MSAASCTQAHPWSSFLLGAIFFFYGLGGRFGIIRKGVALCTALLVLSHQLCMVYTSGHGLFTTPHEWSCCPDVLNAHSAAPFTCRTHLHHPAA